MPANADLRTVSRPPGTGKSDDEELDARGATARQRLLASFRTAALRDAHEIRHPDPELALSVAFHAAVASMATAAGSGLPPEQIRDETTHMCLAYLRGGRD